MSEPSSSLWNKIKQWLKPEQSYNFTKLLRSLERPSIGLQWGPIPTEPLPVGATKWGGRPDVTEDFEWPLDDHHRPLSLLLQINCAELAELDTEKQLPPYGRLYFFYELSEQDWEGLGHSVRVTYCDALKTELHPADFPEDLAEEYRLPERGIQFTAQKSYPTLDDLSAQHPDYEEILENSEAYYETREQLMNSCNGASTDSDCSCTGCCGCSGCGEAGSNTEVIGSLLGYADLIQNNVVEDVNQSVLLLQLSSIETGDAYELLFGDCGDLYFYLSKEDLEARRFDRIQFELQCY